MVKLNPTIVCCERSNSSRADDDPSHSILAKAENSEKNPPDYLKVYGCPSMEVSDLRKSFFWFY